MKLGLMWAGKTDSENLAATVLHAAEVFEAKYGKKPDTVEIPMQCEELKVTGFTVRRALYIMPGYVWVGIGDD